MNGCLRRDTVPRRSLRKSVWRRARQTILKVPRGWKTARGMADGSHGGRASRRSTASAPARSRGSVSREGLRQKRQRPKARSALPQRQDIRGIDRQHIDGVRGHPLLKSRAGRKTARGVADAFAAAGRPEGQSPARRMSSCAVIRWEGSTHNGKRPEERPMRSWRQDAREVDHQRTGKVARVSQPGRPAPKETAAKGAISAPTAAGHPRDRPPVHRRQTRSAPPALRRGPRRTAGSGTAAGR